MSHRIRQLRRTAAALFGSALIVAALPSVAAACQASPTSQPFAAEGDEASYSLAPGGSFEDGAAGWSLSGASISKEPWSVNGIGSNDALAVGAGGTVVSPWICISSEYPTFRLFGRRTSGSSSATLDVSLRWVDLLGLTIESPAGTLQGDGTWAASPILRLGDSVPLWLPGGSAEVALVFRSSRAGSWDMGDVYIDPYRR